MVRGYLYTLCVNLFLAIKTSVLNQVLRVLSQIKKIKMQNLMGYKIYETEIDL